MKHFPILRTRRITAQLKELSIGDAIAIASMPNHLVQAECTAFLTAALSSVSGVQNPADWTVQERTLAVAHYLAVVSEDGPDFSLGEAKYSDYLDGAIDYPSAPTFEVGEVAGDKWAIIQLTGLMAESIERLNGEIPLSTRLHWIVGGMAGQMRRAGEEIPDLATDGLRDEWLLNRMKILMAFPETDFGQLLGAFNAGRKDLHHLFSFTFDDSGIVILPKGGTDGLLPPARFPVSACLSKLAVNLAGKPGTSGPQH